MMGRRVVISLIKKLLMTKQIRYSNLKNHFTILFPWWWSKYTVVFNSVTTKGEKYISFVFRYGRAKYEPIFSIIISPFGEKVWRKLYTDSPLVFLGEFKKLTYSYILPGELPEEFLKPDKSDYDYKRFRKQIRLLVKMVDLVPFILKSFRYIG
jgi:hypothetical protein